MAELECWDPAKWFSLSGENWKKRELLSPANVVVDGNADKTGPAWCHCCEKSINIRCIVRAVAYVQVVSYRSCHI